MPRWPNDCDRLPASEPSDRRTPPDTYVYRVDGANGTTLCPACARALRAAGATVEVLRAARGKCERCKGEKPDD